MPLGLAACGTDSGSAATSAATAGSGDETTAGSSASDGDPKILNIMVENTMSKVEKNKEILTDLKIYHTEKTVQMAGMRRITKTDKMLENKGSKVTFPTKPATRIDAKE